MAILSKECNMSTQLASFDRTLNTSRCQRMVERFWTLVDACGNKANGSQIIRIDQLSDTYSAPPNVSVISVDQTKNLTLTGRPKLTRYCGDTSRVQYRDEWVYPYMVRRIWTIETHCEKKSMVLEQYLSISK